MIISDHEQNTPEWHAARVGLPTASNANLLITSTGARSKSLEGYASKLAADTFAGKDIDAWEGNRFTERGHEIEAEARNWLAFDRDLDIAQVGFCTDNNSRFGAHLMGSYTQITGLLKSNVCRKAMSNPFSIGTRKRSRRRSICSRYTCKCSSPILTTACSATTTPSCRTSSSGLIGSPSSISSWTRSYQLA